MVPDLGVQCFWLFDFLLGRSERIKNRELATQADIELLAKGVDVIVAILHQRSLCLIVLDSRSLHKIKSYYMVYTHIREKLSNLGAVRDREHHARDR